MAEPLAPGGGGSNIRRLLLLGGVLAVVVFAGLFLFFRGCSPVVSGGNGNTVIYSDLDLRDAANVIARLKELNIPYEIREEGRAIAVPKSRADEARLGLAEKNLPVGGAVGWEIFDESRLGATDFDRRIQLIRAISGELSRTIRRIEAVEDARVQIVIPETRLFAAQVAPVTASVMLRLKPGGELSSEKVNGIVHLVASSVENLQPENVTVVDNTGRILTAKGRLAVIRRVPKPAEEKVVAEKSVILRSTLEATVEAVPVPAVKPTPEAVTAVATPPALSAEEKTLIKVRAKKELEANLTGKAQEILNRFYPLNSAIVKVNVDVKNSTNTSYKSLKIRKITAIILVDRRVSLSQELKQSTFKAVAAAIGYDRKRGDRIVMQKVPFHVAAPPPEVVKGEVEKALPPRQKAAAPVLPAFPAGWTRNIIWIIGGIAALLLVLTVARLFRREPALRMEEEPIPARERTVAPERVSAVENLRNMTAEDPERVAEMLRNWLTE